ncbi:LytR/AlgR family response regulator transcription factor [Taibaiella koreensis]|uniref:LytR/AlgR family response regulator transcription factor n=1 Tax=Taibaiella koreensis TaxID=1268548 RepID=UPI000E59FDF1|nr:LytTR family DNA-binding domain-containing protein [Taibaiella koreensis]
MIKTILVDDEPSNSEVLARILEQYCPSVAVAGSCLDITDAARLIKELEPQLIFLDIQMPNGSGFDLLDKMRNKHIEVIFVSAYDNFLLQAIRYSALDYILKPVSVPELVAAVQRAEERLASKSVTRQLELLLSNIQQPAQAQKIAIPSNEGYVFISVADIIRLEAKGAYTEVFIVNGKSYLVSRNIKEYEQLLPVSMFSRVHHAHLVNLQFIKMYHRGRGGYIEMENGVAIEVSVRRKEAFLARFK